MIDSIHTAASLPDRFDFAHPELRRAGAYFARGENREPLLALPIGSLTGSVTLGALASSLNLPADDPDWLLLELVPLALRYRRKVEAGSAMPSELADGSPSWLPQAHVQQRGAALVWRALQPSETAGEALSAAGTTPEQLRDMALRLKPMLPQLNADALERHLRQVILDLARSDWVRRATSALQRTVGEMAQFAAARPSDPLGDTARRTAMLLRNVAIWGTRRAMLCDAATSDVRRLLQEPQILRHRAWPLLGEMRAMALDVEPIVTQWQQARGRGDGVRIRDLDNILRLTVARYSSFDPEIFSRPKLPDPSNETFDA
ncbi:hypothetical protein V6B08_13025 [Ferrovibrio sp. MS7]|uniref:hypothetical protein n=1 Tax=Ferrovibrio plantarum TaxID=3119164 RepID=UPI0031363DBC